VRKGTRPADLLPGAPWFRREIYETVPRWSLEDWFWAIATRHHVRDMGSSGLRSPSHWECLVRDPIAGGDVPDSVERVN
jgi:hypothetical protein